MNEDFPTVILTCMECNDEIMRSELENGKWIHVNDELILPQKRWKYDHEAVPNYIEG